MALQMKVLSRPKNATYPVVYDIEKYMELTEE